MNPLKRRSKIPFTNAWFAPHGPRKTLAAQRATAARGDVALSHGSLGRGEKPVLRGFSMAVKEGGPVALVGGAGGGRRMVLRLPLGPYARNPARFPLRGGCFAFPSHIEKSRRKNRRDPDKPCGQKRLRLKRTAERSADSHGPAAFFVMLLFLEISVSRRLQADLSRKRQLFA